MRRLLDLPLLVILMGIGALAMLLPAAHAVVTDDHRVARAFFYSAVVCLMLIAMLALATATYRPADRARSHLATLLGAYLVLPVMLALPFDQAVRDTAFHNAWFEMVSAFTTTGATVYDDPARLPDSLHLWRALVGWLGGFFALTMAVAVLAPMNLGGFEVIAPRPAGGAGLSMGGDLPDPGERVLRHAVDLLPVYTGLTLVLWLLLLRAGDPGLVALCHAMSVLATSGISPLGPSAAPASGVAGELAMALFLVFALTRRALPVRLTGPRLPVPFWRDPEVRLALALVLAVPGLLFLRNYVGAIETEAAEDLPAALRALWGGVFSALSFVTTTGFVSQAWADTRLWSGLDTPGLLFMGFAIVGGGVATTAGGVKLLRVYALFRHAQREIERLVHPHSVGGQGMGGRRLQHDGARLAWIFFMLVAASIGLFVAALTLAGLAFEPALVFGVAALTTTGPLAQVAAADPLSWALLGPAAKAILGLAMIVGRLETLALVALMAPDAWRR